MKHWTEPKGNFLIQIPIEWQYRNVAVKGGVEEPPYSFEPYEGAIGCFQISCYPLADLAPNLAKQFPDGLLKSGWTHARMDSPEFDTHVFFAAIQDQALIGKYIYSVDHREDERIERQLQLVKRLGSDQVRSLKLQGKLSKI
jgi:hypothetical protein